MGMPKHLSASDIEEFGREMDAIRNEIADSLGSKTAPTFSRSSNGSEA